MVCMYCVKCVFFYYKLKLIIEVEIKNKYDKIKKTTPASFIFEFVCLKNNCIVCEFIIIPIGY